MSFPKFDSLEDQQEWCKQIALQGRIERGISDSDTRACFTITPKFTGMAFLRGRPDPSIRVMVDENSDIGTVCDEIILGLCGLDIDENSYDPQISFSGARGNNYEYSGGGSGLLKNADSILRSVRKIFKEAQEEGRLKPVDVKYDPSIFSKYPVP